MNVTSYDIKFNKKLFQSVSKKEMHEFSRIQSGAKT